MKKSLICKGSLFLMLIFLIATKSSYAADYYIPHITGGEHNWEDVLQADNNSNLAQSFSLYLYRDGEAVLEKSYTVNGYNSITVILKDLVPDADCARISYGDEGLDFQVAHKNLGDGGGIADFQLDTQSYSSISFNFANYADMLAWKGLSVMNTGSSAVSGTMFALANGRVKAFTSISIDPMSKISGVHQTWFPQLSVSEVERIIIITSDGDLSGIAIAGNSDNSQLLFSTAAYTDFELGEKPRAFPDPAIVGYWGVQAPMDECRKAADPLTSFENGYNVLMISFASVGGAPSAGRINFYKDGWSSSEEKGPLTFPSAQLDGLNSDSISYLLETLKSQLVELDNKGALVLLSVGGAGGTMPDPLPEPEDFYDAFVSLNKYFNGDSQPARQLIHGIDWDLENGADLQEHIEWMARVSIYFKKQNPNLIVSSAPQSTNFNPTVSTWTSGVWNCYVPLVYAMESAGTPMDAVMVQWYEPGGSRPDNNEQAISDFIEKYYNPNWSVQVPASDLYAGTTWNMGQWLANNPKRFIPGIGAGKGWNGVTDYRAETLCDVYTAMDGKFGGYMVWDVEIDSGAIAEWSSGNWPLGNGFRDGLISDPKDISWETRPLITNITKNSADATWKATSSVAGEIAYAFTLKNSSGTTVASGTGTSASITGLSSLTSYTLSVTATQNSQTITASTGFSTEGDCAPWDASKTYAEQGTCVTYEGHTYVNQWWTKGDLPSDGGPWKLVS